MQLAVIIFLLVISGLACSIQDHISHQWNGSWFEHQCKRFRLQSQWWDPGISWTNKYKNGNSEKGERFPGSTTILIFVTDAWHCFGFISTTAFQAALATAITWSWWIPVYVIIIKFVYSLAFKLGHSILSRL